MKNWLTTAASRLNTLKAEKILTCVAILAASTLAAPLAPPAQAQGGSSGMGGGGDYLACPDKAHPEKIIRSLLDTYEERDKWTIDTGNAKTLEGRVAYVLDRLAEIDPVRAKRYADEAAPLLKAIREIQANRLARKTNPKLKELDQSGHLFRAIKPLKDIDDADEVYDYVKDGCEKLQIARQEVNSRSQELDYWLDFNLFDLFDLDQQTATVVHEISYHEARDLGALTSKTSREFNRLILDPRMKGYPTCTYAKDLANFGFKGFYILGRAFSQTSGYTCDAQDNISVVERISYPFGLKPLQSGISIELSKLELRNGRIPLRAQVGSSLSSPILSQPLRLGDKIGNGTILFREDGTLLWQEVHKSNDTGTLRFETDAELKILSLQDSGFYNQAIPEMGRFALSKFAQTMKDRESSWKGDPAQYQRALTLTAWVREGIPTGEWNRTDQAIYALLHPDFPLPAMITDLAKDPAAKDWLNRAGDHSIDRCVLRSTSLVFGFIFLLQIADVKATCYLKNGDIEKYRHRFKAATAESGLGAAIYHVNHLEGSSSVSPEGTVELDLGFGGGGVAGILSLYNIDRFGFGDESLKVSWGLGAVFFDYFGSRPQVQLHRRKTLPDLGKLVDELTANILVDRAQFPARR